jgi:RimJ/RimL family protein N-acetyltransferase
MHIPVRILTGRLTLRPLRQEDARDWFAFRSNASVNRYQGWVPGQIQDVYDFIKNRISPEFDRPGTWFQLAILLSENNRLIGDIGIHFLETDRFTVELGYTLDHDYQGLGYASEAVGAVTEYLFNQCGKHRIFASIDPGNDKSIGLVKRLGYRQEAHFRKNVLHHGVWTDTLIFAILKEEWLKPNHFSD